MERRDFVGEELRDRMVDKAVENMPEIDVELRVGDLVWEKMPKKRDAKLRNYRVGQLPLPDDDQRAKVFEPRWTGPWEVMSRASKVAFNVAEPGTVRRPRKVHAANLKPYVTGPNRFVPENPTAGR